MTKNEALSILRPMDNTESALKAAYRMACVAHHPDKGGDIEMMKLVNLAYELLQKIDYQCVDIRTAKKETPLTEIIKPIWDKIKTMPDIDGEIIGTWLWIKGDTYKYRTIFKDMGFKWSKDKKAWYWHNPAEKFFKKSRRSQGWDSIRSYFGSFDLENETANAIG